MSEANRQQQTMQRGPLGRGPMGGPGGHAGMMAGAKAKDFKGTWKRIFGLLKP